MEVTPELIYLEIKHLHYDLGETKSDLKELRQFLEGSDAAPGMKIRVDRLEQREEDRYSHRMYLWCAVGGLIITKLAELLLG